MALDVGGAVLDVGGAVLGVALTLQITRLWGVQILYRGGVWG